MERDKGWASFTRGDDLSGDVGAVALRKKDPRVRRRVIDITLSGKSATHISPRESFLELVPGPAPLSDPHLL